jgi:hypothetical protein
MKTIVLRNSSPVEIRSLSRNQLMAAETVITNVTAIPIPVAVSNLLETPRKGQIPRNLARTKLFTNMAEKKSRNTFISLHLFSFS